MLTIRYRARDQLRVRVRHKARVRMRRHMARDQLRTKVRVELRVEFAVRVEAGIRARGMLPWIGTTLCLCQSPPSRCSPSASPAVGLGSVSVSLLEFQLQSQLVFIAKVPLTHKGGSSQG